MFLVGCEWALLMYFKKGFAYTYSCVEVRTFMKSSYTYILYIVLQKAMCSVSLFLLFVTMLGGSDVSIVAVD